MESSRIVRAEDERKGLFDLLGVSQSENSSSDAEVAAVELESTEDRFDLRQVRFDVVVELARLSSPSEWSTSTSSRIVSSMVNDVGVGAESSAAAAR